MTTNVFEEIDELTIDQAVEFARMLAAADQNSMVIRAAHYVHYRIEELMKRVKKRGRSVTPCLYELFNMPGV